MKLLRNMVVVFIMLFIFLIDVNAETGYTTDKTGLSLRDRPNTGSSNYVIDTIPYNVNFYISNMNAATGGGCSKPWYYVYYNGKYGYVCSSLVKIVGKAETSYDRPWITPKKAIVGGAKFISSGYISKGQNTSYLKKFNVNPNGFYAQFTHQYMANLRAPAGEAYSTYKSLEENNLLDREYNFLIPIYNNMPEKKYIYNGLYSGFDMPTSEALDSSFEKSIKDFPEDYKPYLRAIRKSHGKWTFTPLYTNLDFYDAFVNEKYVSSIEKSSGYCEDANSETEKGWCIANDDTTKYFLDPRNFLTERYVFMFENLGYSDLYNETVVKNVLSDTFMNGKSVLDNQTYSSIFVEAGKTASISPLYLASLARQESGTKVSITTSGNQFTYEGYTYKGLYNFFNIGASSGESNPALAGLVWANGGKGVNNVVNNNNNNDNNETNDNNKPSEVDITNEFISMLKVGKTGEYIRGYDIGTTIKTIKNNVGNGATVVVKDSSGNVKNDNDLIGTGYTIEISNKLSSKSFTYVMFGDLTGDGEINSADLLKMRQYLLGTVNLNGAFLKSAYLSGDGEINSADLLRIRQHLLGTSKIVQ